MRPVAESDTIGSGDFRGVDMTDGITAADNTKKKCVVCKSEMPLDSGYCLECDHYQGLMRLLPVSQTSVAILLAIVSLATSVATVVVGYADRHWIAHNSRIEVRLMESQNDRLAFMLMNTGDRPGYIADVSVKVVEAEKTIAWAEMRHVVTDDAPSTISEAGGVRQVWFESHATQALDPNVQGPLSCYIDYVLTDFGEAESDDSHKVATGRPSEREQMVDCAAIGDLLLALRGN